jgi:bifunctional DNase/RNase
VAGCFIEEIVMEIEMKIRGLMMDPTANTPIIILKDVNGDAMLPIWVGAFEANAIAVEIEKLATQRPMTHDLLKNVIWELGATVRRIIITDLVDNTFFAVIEMNRGGELLAIDSRPSDAIALALRVDCPIYVNDEVVKNSSSTIMEEPAPPQDDWPDDLVDDASDYKM